MPRGPRIFLDNVCYHIINRGNQKQNVFLEESDFAKYLQLLKHYKKKYAFKLFGYCLMPNHIHLILGPKQPQTLSRFMQGLTQATLHGLIKNIKKQVIFGKEDLKV